MRMVEVDLRPELCVVIKVQSEGIPVVGDGGGRERVFGGDRRDRRYVGGGGALAPLGWGRRACSSRPPPSSLLLLRIGSE